LLLHSPSSPQASQTSPAMSEPLIICLFKCGEPVDSRSYPQGEASPRRADAELVASRPARERDAHRRRERHVARHPVHVTMRAREGLPSFRSDRLLFGALRDLDCAEREERLPRRALLNPVQSSPLDRRADDELALSRGMQALSIRMAHATHRRSARGTIFPDRYHAHQLETPRETRAALLYVLQNWAKHGPGGDYDLARRPSRSMAGPPAADKCRACVCGHTAHVAGASRLAEARLLRPGERPRSR